MDPRSCPLSTCFHSVVFPATPFVKAKLNPGGILTSYILTCEFSQCNKWTFIFSQISLMKILIRRGRSTLVGAGQTGTMSVASHKLFLKALVFFGMGLAMVTYLIELYED